MFKYQELHTFGSKWIFDKIKWPFIKNPNKERVTSCFKWNNKTCPQRVADPQIEKSNLRCGTDCSYSSQDILTTINLVTRSNIFPPITHKISHPTYHHLQMLDPENRVIIEVKFAKGYVTIGQSNQPKY
jgi:hypothetical protein